MRNFISISLMIISGAAIWFAWEEPVPIWSLVFAVLDRNSGCLYPLGVGSPW